MKKIDYILQQWRYNVAIPFINTGCELLDIGGFDGSFLYRVQDKIRRGVCIDPYLEEQTNGKITLVKSHVDNVLPFPDSSFDVITLFAVYEHLGEQREVITSEMRRVCRKNGRVLLTVPSSAVDTILNILMKLKLIDGMSTDEHQHFNAPDTIGIFERNGFQLVQWSRFQLDLNNLFIFQKATL